MTAPSAKNKSENSNEAEPIAAPSEASGNNAVEAVIFGALNEPKVNVPDPFEDTIELAPASCMSSTYKTPHILSVL